MPYKKPSSRALRKGRVSLQNQIYLVTFVTENRKHHFADFQCARLMIRNLQNSRHAKTLAFVVMPDHVHWLIQLLDETPLSKVLHKTKSVSARQLNRFLNH
jgi:putative transposase